MEESKRKDELGFSMSSITALLHSGSGLDLRSSFSKDIYLVHQPIVGMRYQGEADELLDELKPGSRVIFLREPDNEHDARAVMALDERGRKIGYIPRDQNAIISALLDAGKSFYGIVPDLRGEEEGSAGIRQGDSGSVQENSGMLQADQESRRREIPGVLFVELYMREFTGPEDLHQIPRQGEQGSYAVIHVDLTEEEPFQIRGMYAIKVINGEEREAYHRGLADETSFEERKRLIEGFDRFAGLLPLVGHGIEGRVEGLLSDAYGVLLGKPFSNRTIDTSEMVRNHLPSLERAPLKKIDEVLGLYSGDAEGAERCCRMIWSLYRRMDHSDLQRKKSVKAVRLTPLENLYRRHKLTAHCYSVLRRAGYLLLGEVLDRSEKDLLKLRGMNEKQVEEIKSMLAEERLSLSEEDFEEDTVSLSFPEALAEYKEIAYEALLSTQMTKTEQLEMQGLSEEERTERINELLDKKLEICRLTGKRKAFLNLLFLGAPLGYRGDFSEAGYAWIDGTIGEQGNKTNGLMILGLFYDACREGRLHPEAEQSMLKVGVTLAEAVLAGDLLEEEEEKIRSHVAALLLRDALFYARKARQTDESMDLLMQIGWYFYEGEAELEDGSIYELEENPELAYKAYYYAEQMGETYAGEMKRTVLSVYRSR